MLKKGLVVPSACAVRKLKDKLRVQRISLRWANVQFLWQVEKPQVGRQISLYSCRTKVFSCLFYCWNFFSYWLPLLQTLIPSEKISWVFYLYIYTYCLPTFESGGGTKQIIVSRPGVAKLRLASRMQLFAGPSAPRGSLVNMPHFPFSVPTTKIVLKFKNSVLAVLYYTTCIQLDCLLIHRSSSPVSFNVLEIILNHIHIMGVEGSGWLANHVFIFA